MVYTIFSIFTKTDLKLIVGGCKSDFKTEKE